MHPLIIGLGHYSRTGKDTFANALIDTLQEMAPKLRVGRKGFASKLKEITHDLYGWAGVQDEAYYNVPANEHERDVKLPALDMTPIEVWVQFGTPAVREQVYDLTWVDYLLKTDHGLDVIVISDVRFPNEIKAIQDTGGHLIKIVRDGYGPKMTVADLALIYHTDWDNVIGDLPTPVTCSGIENLRQWAARYAAHIIKTSPPRVTGLNIYRAPGSLDALKRSQQEINEALAVQRMPSHKEVLAVYKAAGLKFEE